MVLDSRIFLILGERIKAYMVPPVSKFFCGQKIFFLTTLTRFNLMSHVTQHDDALALEKTLSAQKMADQDMIVNETSDGEALDVVLDPKMEQKLLAKLDMAFVPIIMLTYLSCFLDRSNIGKLWEDIQC